MLLSRAAFAQSLMVACLVWLTAGCQSQPKGPPPPLALPAMLTQVTHYVGTPLSGPRAGVADTASPADTPTISVKWVALATPPANVKATLASQCRLLIAGRSGAPMLASPELTQGVLFDASGDAAALETQFAATASPTFSTVATEQGALPPKATVCFTAATAAGPAPRSRIALRTARDAAANSSKIEMTLAIEKLDAASTQPSVSSSETAVFDRSLVTGHDQLALVIPMKFFDSPAQSLLLLIDITPSATPALLSQCQDDLDASAKAVAKEPSTAAVEGSAWAGYESALNALFQPPERRAALVFLAAQTSAHICEDAALVADDSILEALASTIAHRAEDKSVPHTSAALSWLLDRAAFEMLVLSDAPGKGAATVPLPPELKAILTVYAGEPARHGGSLDDIAHQSSSRQDLENRLTAENLVFLTDPSPASRVRAFDWLKARNLAPSGFDPLGPGKQRRQALDKLLSSTN